MFFVLQQATEYVVLAPDGSTETVQNIEIITEEQQAAETIIASDDQNNQYVVIDQSDDRITLYNQQTGETLTYMTNNMEGINIADGVTVVASEDLIEDTIQTIQLSSAEPDVIEAVAMAPRSEDDDAIQQAMLVADVVSGLTEVVTETITS